MSSLAKLQATFNKYTLQRLVLLQVIAANNYAHSGKLEGIFKDHDVDYPARKESGFKLNKDSILKLIAIIDLKMENFNEMILELTEDIEV